MRRRGTTSGSCSSALTGQGGGHCGSTVMLSCSVRPAVMTTSRYQAPRLTQVGGLVAGAGGEGEVGACGLAGRQHDLFRAGIGVEVGAAPVRVRRQDVVGGVLDSQAGIAVQDALGVAGVGKMAIARRSGRPQYLCAMRPMNRASDGTEPVDGRHDFAPHDQQVVREIYTVMG